MTDLVHLFKKLREAVEEQHWEVGVTVTLRAGRTVLVVDRAEAVADLQRFAAEDDPLASGELSAEVVSSMASWGKLQQPVLLLDIERIAA